MEQISSLLEHVQLKQHGKPWLLSTTQMLWDELETHVSQLQLCAIRLNCRQQPLTQEQSFILQQCIQRLTQAQKSIDRWWRQPFCFWQLVHEVDAMVLRILPESMLKERALSIRERFDRKVKDPTQKRLYEEVLFLRDPVSTHDRDMLAGALRLINEQVDKGFWMLAMNTIIQVMSAVMLVLIVGVALRFYWNYFNYDSKGNILLFILLGAAGAIISNMTTKDPFILSVGPTTRYFVYYLFAKPALGGFAAAFFYLLVRSGSEYVTQWPSNLLLGCIALAAGFSGDRFLGATMDKVMLNLFKSSEKTLIKNGPSAKDV
ncbi:hypothetical protein [Corallococcus caeni]|uniref:FUSC family protein n=1 Tax=Corallococcus caeni TaxID=3082388 RepID=A0ABQ6QN75_9BACT|nr:hypothetical protein ASNO1_17070 [Corallococcus sp. NO1]